jgi:uncharacterized protein YycO
MKILAIDSKHNIGSWLIKIFTFSRWNHVAVLFEDSLDRDECSVIDVTLPSKVRITRYKEFCIIYPNHEILDVKIPDEKAAYDFALAQLGKKYDWTGILGIVFQNRSWEKDDKWFCSELVEAICSAGGKRRFRTNISAILPRETYAVI